MVRLGPPRKVLVMCIGVLRKGVARIEAGRQVPSLAKQTPSSLASWHIAEPSREQMGADDDREKNDGKGK